jgi:hypothetical protein
MHQVFVETFGVEKSRRVGEVTCRNAGRSLNPDESDMTPEGFRKLSVDRTAQVRATLVVWSYARGRDGCMLWLLGRAAQRHGPPVL